MKDIDTTNENDESFKGENADDTNFEDLEFVESNEDGETLPTKDVVFKLRADLKICRKEKEEYLTGWQRAKADYVNLQRELELARVNVSILAKEKMVEKLIPALDSFEMAFGNKEHWETLDKEWRMGITSIHSQLIKGLEDSGIVTINEQDVPFDPNIHQSISVVHTDDESKDHTVEKILQVGYKIGDRVIRPAKVIIYDHKK